MGNFGYTAVGLAVLARDEETGELILMKVTHPHYVNLEQKIEVRNGRLLKGEYQLTAIFSEFELSKNDIFDPPLLSG